MVNPNNVVLPHLIQTHADLSRLENCLKIHNQKNVSVLLNYINGSIKDEFEDSFYVGMGIYSDTSHQYFFPTSGCFNVHKIRSENPITNKQVVHKTG